MLLVDSIFSDYTATCLSVYQSHSKSLPFHEASYIVQNQYTVRVLCCLTGDTIMASPPLRVTLYRRGKKTTHNICPFSGLDLAEVWEIGTPWGLCHFFGFSSLHLVFRIPPPGPFGLQPPGASDIPWLSKLGQTAATSFCQFPAQHYRCSNIYRMCNSQQLLTLANQNQF